VLRRGLRFALRVLGRRYAPVLLLAQFLLSPLVVAGSLLLLKLYLPELSWADWGIVVAVAEGLCLVHVVASYVLVLRLVRPARRWLDGARDDDAAVAAWRALVGLPMGWLRFGWGLPAVAYVVPISVFVALLVDEGPFVLRLLALLGGSTVVLLYGAFLHFFAMELIVRPLLERISPALPDGAHLGRASLSLKWKLLVALPVMNIVTGVVAVGLSAPDEGLRSLGFGVIFAIAVAFTISLELALLVLRSVVEPIQDLRHSTERVGRGDLGVRVPVLGSDETGALAGSFNSMVQGLEERERLREAFGAYVDPELADRVLAEGTELAGEEVEVTVLFLDVRDFTPFAERASAREVVAALNELYDLVVPVIVRHGGHANKFVGDGLLAVFGAPDRLADHADRAVAAACELSRLVAERGPLAIGVGVNTGTVLAGTVGGGGRLEFTVIGDPVNTAARVEALTRETGDALLITEATRRALRREHGGWAPRGTVELRGRSEPVAVHAPAGQVGARDGLRALPVARR
jgi:class 3 adenylate cyclase